MAGESAAGQAANAAALDKAAQDWAAAFSAPIAAIPTALDEAGQFVVATIESLLHEPYPPASLPGEPPHERTGTLAGSYEAWTEGSVLYIGTPVFYAPFLEFGTSRMAARPHFRIGIELSMAGDALPRRLAVAIAQAQTAALAGRRLGPGGGGASESHSSGAMQLIEAMTEAVTDALIGQVFGLEEGL